MNYKQIVFIYIIYYLLSKRVKVIASNYINVTNK